MSSFRKSMTNGPSIATVICTYASDRLSVLNRSIESVLQQSRPVTELIVSVDHNPALAERLRNEYADLIIVENLGPRGLSGARNAGIAAATSDVIAFLDDDARADPDWLEWLAVGYDDPNVVAVGGSIIPDWVDGRPGWFPDEFDWVVGCTYRGMPTDTSPIRNLIGANMSFRREIFESVGGFRTGIGRVGVLPVGCEETELCIRVRQRYPDQVILFEPRARIAHLVPTSRGTMRYYFERCFAEGKSKTAVTRHVGASDGLASERVYTLRTLPSGVVRGLAATVRHGHAHGSARAVAITAGLLVTTLGFASSQVAAWWNDRVSNQTAPVDSVSRDVQANAESASGLEYAPGDAHD